MEMAYSPTFTALCKGEKSGKYGFRKLGMFEVPFYAMGIKFPETVRETDGNFFTDLRALKDSQYVKSRPIVIFPEGTKTNGMGILNFEEGVSEIIIKAALDGMHVHTLRFDYAYNHSTPYNSTDVFGLKATFKLLT